MVRRQNGEVSGAGSYRSTGGKSAYNENDAIYAAADRGRCQTAALRPGRRRLRDQACRA